MSGTVLLQLDDANKSPMRNDFVECRATMISRGGSVSSVSEVLMLNQGEATRKRQLEIVILKLISPSEKRMQTERQGKLILFRLTRNSNVPSIVLTMSPNCFVITTTQCLSHAQLRLQVPTSRLRQR